MALCKKCSTNSSDLDMVVKHYLVAALWSSTYENDDGDTIEMDRDFDTDDFSQEALAEAKKDCAAFLKKAEHLLADADPQQVGHDFWLTRNGHGAGFWDRPEIYGEDASEELTRIAKTFGEEDVYVGDDGILYLI